MGTCQTGKHITIPVLKLEDAVALGTPSITVSERMEFNEPATSQELLNVLRLGLEVQVTDKGLEWRAVRNLRRRHRLVNLLSPQPYH